MRRQFTRARHALKNRCTLCGLATRPEFEFDCSENEDGSLWAHPDCFSYENSTEESVPSRHVVRGYRLLQTCGNALCTRPSHLATVVI